jgi:hypothetical protein
MMEVVVFCGCGCCLLAIIAEEAVHALKEYLFSIFPISNQQAGPFLEFPGHPDVVSLVLEFY